MDDNIIVGSARSFIVGFKSAFGVRFNVPDLGPLSCLLGMTVDRDRGNRIIKIGQQQYVLVSTAGHNRLILVGCAPCVANVSTCARI
jgi:hypothetical protein